MRQRSYVLWMTLLGLIGIALISPYYQTLTPSEATTENVLGWVEEHMRPVLYANPPAPTDSVGSAEAFRAIGDLHQLQARIAQAQADDDSEAVTHLLDRAMRELHSLTSRPGLAERPRFRHIFRALTTEYESRYGVPDTLRLPEGAIYDTRQEWFSALNESPPLQLDAVLPTNLRHTNTEIHLPLNERVRTSIAFLLRTPKRNLKPWLQRSATYFPMIEHILAEENVPDELKYLALVESGLNPYAYSHARAAGMWQFVAKTGRRYGLTIDPWVDERMDPEKSTRAAAQHLRDLYEMFGDWHLAMAGYNCSPRIVQRAVANARERLGRQPTFWDIYPRLPQETRNYVPLFIATAVIVSNPSAFGIERRQPGPRYAFDHVPVRGSYTLETIARLAEADVETVRSLNPELRSDRLPPSKHPYYVRLPYGTYETFAANYDTLSRDAREPRIQHAVQPGETLGRIARRYQVARPALLETNAIDPNSVRVGQRLTVPAMHYVGNAAVVSDAEARPIRVRYGNRAVRPLITKDANTPGIISPAPITGS